MIFAQNHRLQQGLDAKCPDYPCWAWLWVESLPSCRKKNLLPEVLQLKGAAISAPDWSSGPTQGSALGRQGFQEDSLINPAAEAAQVLVHQAHQHFRLLSGVRRQLMGPLCYYTVNGWVAAPSQEASGLAFPAPSVMDRYEHWKCYMLVSDPAALLVHVNVPYSI